ncbi:MAG: hypothetical protein QM811_03640 [Pirellulales bacterium]
MRFLSGEAEIDAGYIDLATAVKGRRDPVLILERATLKRFVPANQEFTRWVPEPRTATREYVVKVPVTETRTKQVMEPSGDTKTIEYAVTKMVHEARTVSYTTNGVRKVVRTAERDQTIDVEGLLVSVIRDLPADRKTTPPEMPKNSPQKAKPVMIEAAEEAVPAPPLPPNAPPPPPLAVPVTGLPRS